MAQFQYSGRISPVTLDGYTFTKGSVTEVTDYAVIRKLRRHRAFYEIEAAPVESGQHTHPISEIDGLQATLDAKQNAGEAAPGGEPAGDHGHVIADVTGLEAALSGKQPVGSYALDGHTHNYQPAGSYAAASHNHDAAYQPIGSYVATASFTWTNLTGKPSTFTPSAHTHTIADVTNLQVSLDAKQAAGSYAAAVHNHDAAYAAIEHNHAGVYQPFGSYSLASHDHAGVYQPVGTYLSQFGYSTGNGGTVTQATNKATAVTLNKLTGEITMNAAALAAAAVVTFALNNSTVAVGDMLVTSHHSGGTVGPYLINGRVTGAGVCSIAVRNTGAASLSEAIVIKFAVIKAVSA